MIHLGYEIGTGKPIEIPIKHTCITGQSQEAGKTTALEALITRSGLRAVTFITKRGEGSFEDGRRIAPFFRERADWVFVSSLIDSTLGEKNKLLRAWLMKVCRDTKTLADVQQNVKKARSEARGFSESIYTEIEGYLELVVPQLAQLPPATKVEIGPGLNVMDLSPYSTQLQGLVIPSVLEHIYEHEEGVITVIPEAWEFLPEGRGSPVKLAARTLLRKGGVLKNFMWIDSQDLGGVDKEIVRGCPLILIGVQREANEIKRTLLNVPAGVPKLTPADLATLELGQFFACWGKHAIKTYVQPTWMDGYFAKNVSLGTYSAEQASAAVRRPATREDVVTREEATRLRQDNARLTSENAQLVERLERLEARLGKETTRDGETTVHSGHADPSGQPRPERTKDPASTVAGDRAAAASRGALPQAAFETDDESRYQAFKARLTAEAPFLIRQLEQQPEIEIAISRPTLQFEEHSMKWRLVRLLSEGFFDASRRSCGQIRSALKRTGPDANTSNISRAMDDLVKTGVFTDEGSGYAGVPGIKLRVLDKAAAA